MIYLAYNFTKKHMVSPRGCSNIAYEDEHMTEHLDHAQEVKSVAARNLFVVVLAGIENEGRYLCNQHNTNKCDSIDDTSTTNDNTETDSNLNNNE